MSHVPHKVDDSTLGIITVSYEEHEIHEGEHYFIDHVYDQAINNVYDIQITTPDTTKWIHFNFSVICENETLVYFYENCSIILAGTTLPSYNNNRNSSNTTALTIATSPNISVAAANADTDCTAATELTHNIVGTGRTSGEFTRDNEIILKQNEDYCLRIVASAAGFTNFKLQWYEHTDLS